MMDRDAVLAAVDGLVAARARGDKAEVARRFAPGATYEMMWDAAADLPGFPAGCCDAASAIGQLIDLVDFRAHERLDAIVEDGRAAVLMRVRAAPPGADDDYEALICGIWHVAADGRILSLREFADTADLVARLGD